MEGYSWTEPVSILDVGPTLCGSDGKWIYGCMARKGLLKFVSYYGYERQDMLFHVKEDPLERHNLAGERVREADDFRQLLCGVADPAQGRPYRKRMRAALVCWPHTNR